MIGFYRCIRVLACVTLCVLEMTTPLDAYRIGVGKGDITGPVAEVVLMGFADTSESAAGLLNRLYARTFIVEDETTTSRVVLVNCDLQGLYQLVHQEVILQLQTQYNGLYTAQNVLLHATHQHAGPGGTSAYASYDISIFGFVKETFDAVVAGILQAIAQAHNSMAPGAISFNSGKLLDANKNRSPDAYARNPASERGQYATDCDVDMRVLQFRDNNNSLRGVLGWFPVHATSLTHFNRLVSSDNKGYAEWLIEQQYPGVVAGVGVSNAADVSPNRIDNGDGTFRGEGKTPIESAEIIGTRQANKVLELLQSPATTLQGSVVGKLSFVDFSNVTIQDRQPTTEDPYYHRTCPAVLGQNIAAGTEDGRMLPGFTEGDLKANPFFLALGETLQKAPQWVKDCQHVEKVPMLAVGLMKPIPWVPEVLPVQVIKLGQFALAITNFETTTMAGRRIRATIKDVMAPAGVNEVEIVSCSNAYAQYMTTREEYFRQDYEGASTMFGPNQLAAVQQELARVARSIVNTSVPLDVGPSPRTFDRSKLISMQTGVVYDNVPLLKHFGDVRTQPANKYSIGTTATAAFYGGHPKNNLQQVSSYCDVEKQSSSGWSTFLRDDHWDVRFHWQRVGIAGSNSTCEWLIRSGQPTSVPGTYRFHHRGFSKSLDGTLTSYDGVSTPFLVV